MKNTLPIPEETIKKLWDTIDLRYKITFASAMICGLLAHLYQFTNKLFNYDELDATPDGTVAGMYLSRWSQALLARIVKILFKTNTSLPMVNGMLALILFSLSACLIVYALKIRSLLFCGMIGGVCTTFSTVTSTYFFMYMAGYYAMALLLSCAAALLMQNTSRKRRESQKLDISYIISFLLAVFILAFSTGIYQAYFPVAVCILLSGLMLECYDEITKNEGRTVLEFVLCGVEYVVFLGMSLVAYLGINKLALKLTNSELPSYQGMDSIGTINLSYIISEIGEAYKHTVQLLYTDVYQLNPTRLIRLAVIFLMISALAAVIIVFLKAIREKKLIWLKILFGLLIFIYPISLFLVCLMSTPETYVYTIMLYAVIFAIIMPVAVIDRFNTSELGSAMKRNVANAVSWVTMIAMICIVSSYIWAANCNYQAIQYTNYHDILYYTTMVTQMKSIDGYRDDLPVIFIGSQIDDSSNEAGDLLGKYGRIAGRSNSNVNAYSWYNILRYYIGFTQEVLWSDEDEERFYKNESVVEMPCYPDAGSIRIIEDTIVVKLQGDEEL